jgi:hypothetical protein
MMKAKLYEMNSSAFIINNRAFILHSRAFILSHSCPCHAFDCGNPQPQTWRIPFPWSAARAILKRELMALFCAFAVRARAVCCVIIPGRGNSRFRVPKLNSGEARSGVSLFMKKG